MDNEEKKFEIDDIGYFLYCDGNRFSNKDFLYSKNAIMEFKITLIPYITNTSWIEDTLSQIYSVLREQKRPKHSLECEYGKFLSII